MTLSSSPTPQAYTRPSSSVIAMPLPLPQASTPTPLFGPVAGAVDEHETGDYAGADRGGASSTADIARRARPNEAGLWLSWKSQLAPTASALIVNATSSGSVSAGSSPFAIAVLASCSRTASHRRITRRIASLTGPGRASNSTIAVVRKQPPRISGRALSAPRRRSATEVAGSRAQTLADAVQS
jgi:hypothetical protein